MRRDAVLAASKHGVDAVIAVERTAAAAGLALVAGQGGIPKVVAPGALQKIAARRGHVPQLRRRT